MICENRVVAISVFIPDFKTELVVFEMKDSIGTTAAFDRVLPDTWVVGLELKDMLHVKPIRV